MYNFTLCKMQEKNLYFGPNMTKKLGNEYNTLLMLNGFLNWLSHDTLHCHIVKISALETLMGHRLRTLPGQQSWIPRPWRAAWSWFFSWWLLYKCGLQASHWVDQSSLGLVHGVNTPSSKGNIRANTPTLRQAAGSKSIRSFNSRQWSGMVQIASVPRMWALSQVTTNVIFYPTACLPATDL